MTKKEYIFKILNIVKWHRNKEEKIRKYMTENEDSSYTEYLYEKFRTVIHTIYTQKGQKEISWFVDMMNNIKEKEKIDRNVEQEDINKLENLIDSL